MPTRNNIAAPDGTRRKINHRVAKANKKGLMLWHWVGGYSYEEIAEAFHVSVDDVRKALRDQLYRLRCALVKWKRAEVACRALAMELKFLRVGLECPEDQPIEALNPPPCWLRHFKLRKINTVNYLRSIDMETLLAYDKFPVGAIDWSIMKLDKLGLSHRLKRPEKQLIFNRRQWKQAESNR